jgi:multidrug resistance efflux pump
MGSESHPLMRVVARGTVGGASGLMHSGMLLQRSGSAERKDCSVKFEHRPPADRGKTGGAGNGGGGVAGFQPYSAGDVSLPAKVSTPPPVQRPSPLPKRPKGRFFVAALLLGVCAFGAYNVWDAFFRYRAYGVVQGTVIEVSVPWDGAVQYIHVTEGEAVRQGQVLLTLENVDLRQQLARLEDELRLAQANLEAEVSKLKWDKQWQEDRYQDARVDYYEVWGKLLEEQAKLTRLKLTLTRTQELHDRHAVSDAELEQALLGAQGQRQKVEKLQSALVEARSRVETTLGRAERGSDQLKPKLIAIESLHGEIARARERLDQGQVCSPVNGLLVKRHCSVGERLHGLDPVFSILEEGSLEVVMYLPQSISTRFGVGDRLFLEVDPYHGRLPGTVVRLGEQYETAPESIARHYRKDQQLLPVHVSPDTEFDRWMALRVGGVAKLPFGWPRLPERGGE